jgi:hypothetical protein
MWGDGMSVIQVKCTDQVLKITSAPVLASGGVNEVKVEFDFCEKWDGYLKTALFYRDDGDIYYALLDSNDTCVVPWEVCYSDGTFYFSVFGDKDSVRRTSTTVKYKVKKGVVIESMIPSDPTPEVYDQIVSLVNDYKPSVLTVNLADSTHATHSSDEIEAHFNRGWNVLFAVDYRLLALDRIEGTKAVFLSTYDDGSGVETIEHTINENKEWAKTRHANSAGIAKESDPTVPAWAKQPSKPSYTAQEVGAMPADTQIPVVPSALPNPHKLNFTGAVTATYDGSEEVTVQIPEGGDGGGLAKTLLWENANPHSEFAAQTIQINGLSDYDAIEILYTVGVYQPGYGLSFKSSGAMPNLEGAWEIPYSLGYVLDSVVELDVATDRGYRAFHLSGNAITFRDAYEIHYYGDEEVDNTIIIPARIYGIVNGAQYLEVIENGSY